MEPSTQAARTQPTRLRLWSVGDPSTDAGQDFLVVADSADHARRLVRQEIEKGYAVADRSGLLDGVSVKEIDLGTPGVLPS